jgi:hypothetical protein
VAREKILYRNVNALWRNVLNLQSEQHVHVYPWSLNLLSSILGCVFEDFWYERDSVTINVCELGSQARRISSD